MPISDGRETRKNPDPDLLIKDTDPDAFSIKQT